MNRRMRIAICVVLAVIPMVVLWPRGQAGTQAVGLGYSEYTERLDSLVGENIPLRGLLGQAGLALRMAGGNREQDGVHIARHDFIKKLAEPDEAVMEQNMAAVRDFARYCQSINRPLYFMLIPTAEEILRGELPRFYRPVNQKQLMEEAYAALAGELVTVDSYTPLYASRERYLYYHTEDNLTALGGYYIYTALARRLRVEDAPSLSHYEIRYREEEYYGNLYELSPWKRIEGDVLMTFHFSRYEREYAVTQTRATGKYTWHALYGEHMADLGRPMEMYPGASAAVCDIIVSSPWDRSLLVFGDHTAQAWLPFLTSHYRRVTFVNPAHNPALFAAVDPEAYDQVLVAFSVDSWASSRGAPASLTLFVE